MIKKEYFLNIFFYYSNDFLMFFCFAYFKVQKQINYN